ncbi:sugar phosphate isomerase/epimerase family protein [Natronosalvus halobius]|uniref:sugar phosphate isomerase/epimerase family protein n=1 Tax=Natronosalvus halobius TaxID=2953746 RepID=UPI00209DF446|nr:sugar phosphate isomerase/epimerase family protein [Natronosalvus halobius]USZ72436.1 sugar phosphate isomerase/epimerase [Natronosalvus halobius]
MTIRVGLCTISDKERPLEEVLDLASDAGYDGVEIWGRDHVADGSEETCERINEVASARGLEIASYGSYLRCGSDDFDDDLEHELAVTDSLDTDIIRVWAGSQEYGDHDEDHWDRVVADLERLTERAADYDVEITVEKHNNTVTHTREGARRLIEAIDDERCRLNYQPGFSIPAPELEREARELAPLSNQLHLQTTRERTERARAPLAEAYYDLEAILEPFLEDKFDGFANVEFVTDERPYREAIEADLETVRSFVSTGR